MVTGVTDNERLTILTLIMINNTRYSFADLPTLLDRELTSRGLNDNRFAVVGFGGLNDLVRPHIFTAGSKIVSDAVKMTSAMNRCK